MSYKKPFLKALGMSLALLAFTAAAAQANWLVLDPLGGAVHEPAVTIGVSAHTEGLLLVPAQNLVIHCAVVKSNGTEPVVLLAASTIGHGKINFESCSTLQNGKLSTICKPVEPIVAGGLVLIVLHNGVNKLLFDPPSGQPFAHVTFGGLCALPKLNEVTGTLAVECGILTQPNVFSLLDCKEHKSLHLLRPAADQTLYGDGLFFGANPATLHGIADVKIVAPALYEGADFGGHV